MFTSSTKRETRQFHVVVVQWRQRKLQKSVMHVRSCCFVQPNLLLFFRSRCRRGRRCWSSLVSGRFRKVVAYENRTASDLYEEKCGHIKFVVIHVVPKSSFHTLSKCGRYSDLRDQTIVYGGRLEEVENSGKFLNSHPKKCSRLLTRGSRLLGLPTVRFWLGNYLVFWIGGQSWEGVAFERWSHVEIWLITITCEWKNGRIILRFYETAHLPLP